MQTRAGTTGQNNAFHVDPFVLGESCGLVVGSVVFAVDMWGFLSGRRVFNATHMRGFCGRELLTARMLTTPRTRGTLRGVGSPPRIATASTHHRRDEQSNADGNLTGQI